MESLGQYVIFVISSAMICGVVLGFFPNGAAKELVRMLCGIFLALSVLSPISRIDVAQWTDFDLLFNKDAAQTAAMGEAYSQNALREIIKEETRAYILDKAAALGADISADVSVSGDALPVPVGVQVTGIFSPYVKQRLEVILQEELGIAKENQLWTRFP